MKYAFLTLVAIFAILSINQSIALSPFSFQGAAYNSSGSILVDQTNLSIRITISDNNTNRYQEVFTNIPSNAFGTFSVSVGTGTPQAGFAVSNFNSYTVVTTSMIKCEVAVGAGSYVTTYVNYLYAIINLGMNNTWKAGSIVPEVVTFKGAYNAGTTYAQNDLVSSSTTNVYFYSLTAGANTGNTPETSTSFWQPVTVDQLHTIRKTNVTLGSPGFTSLFSISGLTANSPASGGRVLFTIVATDGGTQVATAEGTIQWNARSTSVTTTVSTDDVLSLGTVNPGGTPGFYNPGSQPGVAIFDNVTFGTPAAIVMHEVYFRILHNGGLSYVSNVAQPVTIRLEY